MKKRPPIDPNQPITLAPFLTPEELVGCLLFILPMGIPAWLFDLPAWTLWLGPAAAFAYTLAEQRQQMRRITAAWNQKLIDERSHRVRNGKDHIIHEAVRTRAGLLFPVCGTPLENPAGARSKAVVNCGLCISGAAYKPGERLGQQ